MYRFLLTLFLLISCASADEKVPAGELIFEPLFPKMRFKRPIGLIEDPQDKGSWYVLEQRGKIFHCRPGGEKQLVIDFTKRLGNSNEEGLLSLVLAPDFATSAKVYVYYSAKKPRRSVIASFLLKNKTIHSATEEILLEIPEPYGNHNGGQLVFGPDGYLYIGVGDGGAAADPHGNGQDLSTLHAAILRLDVSKKSAGKNYAIPADNPFIGQAKARPEIYAYGLRNPWRFSFDPKTQELYCADVGQNKQEEIDLIVKGGNYGWNQREGTLPYKSKKASKNWIEPFFVYGRKQGISVTGGFVYRGKDIPELRAWYVCSDFATGRYWLLKQEKGKLLSSLEFKGKGMKVSSFARDSAGELYIMSFAKNNIFKLKGWKKP